MYRICQMSFVILRRPTKVCIDEDGLGPDHIGHGLQVTVVPAVSLHVVRRHKRFADLSQPHYSYYFNLTLCLWEGGIISVGNYCKYNF